MPIQKILLWVMLASLGVAAALGAYSALTAHPDTVYRIIGSLILAAICSGLLLVAVRQRTSPAARAAGLTAGMLILCEFIIGMGMIWNLLDDERTAELMGSLMLTGLLAVVLVRLLGFPSARVAGAAGLALDATTLGLWITAIYQPMARWNTHLFEDGWSVAWMGLLAVCSLVGIGKDRWHWRWLGIAAAVAACYGMIRTREFDWFTEPLPLLIGVAAVLGHANLVLRAPLRGGQRWLALATIAAGVGTAAAINANDYVSPHRYAVGVSDIYIRLAGASGILAGCGTLAVAILARINSKTEPAPSPMLKSSSVALDCPACGQHLNVGKNPAACSGCGLLISVKLEEPRCAACGYSLLMLKSDHCPECGTAVRSIASPAVPALAT
jgi:hypothetical protein